MEQDRIHIKGGQIYANLWGIVWTMTKKKNGFMMETADRKRLRVQRVLLYGSGDLRRRGGDGNTQADGLKRNFKMADSSVFTWPFLHPGMSEITTGFR